MHITVTGQQIDITTPLRDYVIDKLGRIQRHFDQAVTADVVLHMEKKRFSAEANIRARGTVIHALAEGAEGEDMYTMIDLLADKLDRQVLRHKEKAVGQYRPG
ncbi:MAG: ribosome-associated translation inhibitor RaiA [Gammaproteobacteria bacterium]|nr:ribosome-associated translation inhibitor RaiA [Gammaproteobacteria bacterium]